MSPTLQRLTAQGRALVQRFKPQSASVRNVLKLAGGTAGSQVITVAAAPILTRLYGPESFGVLATFTSIVALLNVVSSLRYELAIVVPEDEDEAIALVWLCFGLVAISTALTGLGVALLGNQLVSWLHQPALKPLLWLLPVGVLLTGIYQPLSYWAIRRKQFGLLARTKFRQTFFCLATNLAAAPLGTIGLLLGQIVSQSAGFLTILNQSPALLLTGPQTAWAAALKTLRRYGNFAIYSSPSGVVNIVGSELPTLIFASTFGSANTGELAIAQRLLILPAGLIGGSISQVFLAEASRHWHIGSLGSFVQKIGAQLFATAILLSILISFFIAPAASFVLGAQWENVQQIIPALIPLFIGQFTVSTLSMAFVVSEKNKLEMLSQVGQTVLRLGALVAAVLMNLGFELSVLAFAAGSLLGYMSYASVLLFSLSDNQKGLDA